MKQNKEQLLQNLFAAIEKRQAAEYEKEYCNLFISSKDDLRKRAEAEVNYLIAEYEADEAYTAYIECLRAEKGATADA